MNILKVVSQNIKLYRRIRGYTQEKLAEEIDVSGSYIGYLERGQRSPSLELLANIASVLKITPADLLNLPNNNQSQELKKLTAILTVSEPELIQFTTEVVDAYFRSFKT